ncbi:MAG TPA: hypothetical protein VJR91_03170 [Burkholderia sp.]|uniref:hypothetical protein n=1 Tax=Burkholderia pyrrocinia TaxID=60550 RepID=UPI00215B37D1|nr:hypothetical protein [Burkholderia pyrrocinia]UVE69986.1 hypothetical protein L2Y90_33185 [Burkholderia pyrrocinia]HKT62561.1 hypothetical protein [Burkholderia sp.]
MTHAGLLEMDAVPSAPVFFGFLGDVDCDSVLDSRDAEPFDAPWMAAFDAIDGDPGTAIDRPAVDTLREKAFKLAFGASGNAGAAACVPDCIEPIARSRMSGRTVGWPARILWNAYQNGRFPRWLIHFRGFQMRGDRGIHDRNATRIARRRVRACSPASTQSFPSRAPDCQTV